MQGPIAARTRSRRAPSFSMAAMVVSTTPPKAPFQPACAAPITWASASANSTGAQSAASTPSTTPGRSVTSASPLGAPGEVQRWAAAVFAHIVRLIARTVAAVERGIEAFAHAALAREEAMLHAVEVGKGARLDH